MANYALPNDIRVGSNTAPILRFRNSDIALNSLAATIGVDVIGNQLSIDTFSFTIRHVYDKTLIYAPWGVRGYRDTNGKIYRLKASGKKQYTKFVPKSSDALVDSRGYTFQTFFGWASGDFLALEYGTPVWWYSDGSLFLKGYTQKIERTGRYAWKVTCVSGVGLLDTRQHAGGMYNGEKLRNVANSIIGNAFTFSCPSDVANIPIYGHLPRDKARNNLHRLLFAAGASLVKGGGAYEYSIRFLDTTEVDVPSDRIALGGSVTAQLPANAAEVTEHAFFALSGDEDVVLFDNTDAIATASGTIVVFDAPMHDLAVTGTLTINESNVNYAVVSGTGVLTGKRYTHTTHIVTAEGGDGERRVVRVTDNELISFANSRNVSKRVLDYFASAKTLKAKMILANERPGANLSLTDAFGELTTAFLAKMSVSVTTVKAAQCELIEGFVPRWLGNNYSQKTAVTQSGTFTVPAGVTMLRIVLFGGADGGQGGFNGMDGACFSGGDSPETPRWGDLHVDYVMFGDESEWYIQYTYANLSTTPEQALSEGGAAGAPGASGKIAIYDVDVVPGETITVTIGTGGAGGNANGGSGSAGSATTVQSASIGTLSSADGVVLPSGYFDPIEGRAYGGAGAEGHAGGNGGQVDTRNLFGTQGYAGLPGGSVGEWTGGAGGAGLRDIDIDLNPHTLTASGGAGGGAAWGANGSPGTAAAYGELSRIGVPGAGGAGANATAPTKAGAFGVGGSGGNGGGGGGNAGGGRAQPYSSDPVKTYLISGVAKTRAPGGSGSAGGEGGDGGALFYFN